MEQVVFYQQGIGNSFGFMSRLQGGMFGIGLAENVREAYGFIVHNWQPHDELYLFGFSRGAYTARTVAGLISECGILTKWGMDGIATVLDAYMTYPKDDKKTAAAKKFARIHVPDDRVPIEFIGVWDTVGSYGVPEAYCCGCIPPFWPLTALINAINLKSRWVDTSLHDNVKTAMHAYFSIDLAHSVFH